MTTVFISSIVISQFDDQLSSNFNRFVILCICWDTPSENIRVQGTTRKCVALTKPRYHEQRYLLSCNEWAAGARENQKGAGRSITPGSEVELKPALTPGT